MRQLITKYANDCRKCGAHHDIGSTVIYEKHVGIFCLECEPKDTEEIRKWRQEAGDRRASKLEEWASKRREKANAILDHDQEHYREDIAFNTQPGHFPFRDRVIRRDDKAYESLNKAKRMEERAKQLRKVRVKGDAEKKWQAVRDQNRQLIKPGMLIDIGFASGPCRVKRINKKTVTVVGTDDLIKGNEYRVDLYLLNDSSLLLKEFHKEIYNHGG